MANYPQPKTNSLWELATDMSALMCAADLGDIALECSNIANDFEMAALHDLDDRKSGPAADLRSEAKNRLYKTIRAVTGKRPKEKFEAMRLVRMWAESRGLKTTI